MPRRARAPRALARRVVGDPAQVPRRLLRPRAGPGARAPTSCGGARASCATSTRNLAAGRGPVVHGRRRHRQDDAGDARLEGRARRAAARSRSTPCRTCWPRSATPTTRDRGRALLHGLLPPARRGRPAPPRGPRRREADRLGAGAALLAGQRALRGAALDPRHHEPAACRAARGADRRAHRVAPDRDLRRPAAALRRGPARSRATPSRAALG